jgi:hypothetical protein
MKQPTQQYLKHLPETITGGGSSLGTTFAENLEALHNLIEGILSVDGYKPKVSSIKIHLRMYSEQVFSIQPIVVQTAGTFSDTVDNANSVVETLLNDAIDDVFGYQRIGNVSTAKRVPTSDASSSSGTELGIQRTVEIPGNILGILNKEVETERLQALYFGFVGIMTANTQNITVESCVEVTYSTISKKIILR